MCWSVPKDSPLPQPHLLPISATHLAFFYEFFDALKTEGLGLRVKKEVASRAGWVVPGCLGLDVLIVRDGKERESTYTEALRPSVPIRRLLQLLLQTQWGAV